ncbi:MAG: type II secretion system F family protein [Candidatus Niyogibacteria bacterium]|nr:type II secretion system F family protein [Candidatus Niyogibacteria bacterium]
MTLFSYTAKKISGEETHGTKDAKDKFDLAKMLRCDGYSLIAYAEIEAAKSASSGMSFNLFSRVSVVDKMIFARNVAVMIDAGVSLAKSLDILASQTKSVKFCSVLNDVAAEIRKGRPLSDSMADHHDVFSSLFISMVKAGEEGGNLSETFRLLGHQMEKEHALFRRVRGALVYPSIIIVAMMVIGVLMLIYVVPTLVSTFKELSIELPPTTKAIIAVSNFIVSHTFIFLALVAAIIGAITWFLRTEIGQRWLSSALLHLPIFKTLVQEINAARTARTLGSLIGSGVDVLRALEITEDVLQNYYYRAVLREARERVQKGKPIAEVFKENANLYPLLVGEMMSVGEETGKLSEMLGRLADFYEEEVSAATQDMSTIVEPILMVIIGVVVGFFAISMIQPLYSSLSNL